MAALVKRSPNSGRPKHRPTKELRRTVENMAGMGIPQLDICSILGLGSHNTLRKYYSKELEQGMAKTRSNMLRRWYQDCLDGTPKDKESWLRIFGPPEFKESTQRLEITGAGGKPVEITPVPMDDARLIEVARSLAQALPEGIIDGDDNA